MRHIKASRVRLERQENSYLHEIQPSNFEFWHAQLLHMHIIVFAHKLDVSRRPETETQLWVALFLETEILLSQMLLVGEVIFYVVSHYCTTIQ